MESLIKFGLLICFFNVISACRNGNIIRTGITADEKKLILEIHNNLRQTVAQGRVSRQPSAQNMQEMVWDDELAQKAQQWANQCHFQHDPSRYSDRFTMGENLGHVWSTAQIGEEDGGFNTRINSWFNEVQIYSFGSAFSPKTGHYSQLVWHDTNLVGCGFTYYQDANHYNKLYVCKYGPGGNILGSNPYETGQPQCATHNMATSPRYPGLCMVQNYYTEYSVQNNVIPQNDYHQQQQQPQQPIYKKPVTSFVTTYQTQTQTQTKPQTTINNDYTFSKYFTQYTNTVQKNQEIEQQKRLKEQQNRLKEHQDRIRAQQLQLQQQQQAQAQQLKVQQQAQQAQQAQQQKVQQQQQQKVKQQPDFNSAFLTYDWSTLFNNVYTYTKK